MDISDFHRLAFFKYVLEKFSDLLFIVVRTLLHDLETVIVIVVLKAFSEILNAVVAFVIGIDVFDNMLASIGREIFCNKIFLYEKRLG